MQELYEKAARAAYENCLALLGESKILAEHSKFARAYALCVLASEEFCKSFLYKAVSAGLVTEKDVQRVVTIHSEKIARFVHIIVSPSISSLHADEIEKAIEHDKGEPDHAKHIYLDVMRKVHKDAVKYVPTITAIFARANDAKLNALYVDIVGNRVVVPTDVVGHKEFDAISWFLNTFVRGFEIILNEDDTTFSRVAASLDPEFRYILKPRT